MCDRVLLIEDSPTCKQQMREVVEECGSEVLEASALHQAVPIIAREMPSVVVMDWVLGDEDPQLSRQAAEMLGAMEPAGVRWWIVTASRALVPSKWWSHVIEKGPRFVEELKRVLISAGGVEID